MNIYKIYGKMCYQTFGGKLKRINKLIFIPILLIFINCTALNTLPNTDFESEKINIENITLEIKDAASLNKYNKLKGIVTDSEGLSDEEKLEVENAFNCPVYQTYGLSEVGLLAVQCKYGHYHIFSDRCYVEIVDAEMFFPT